MKTISISQYNALYHIAENILQKSWRDLGLSEEEIVQRSKENETLKALAAKSEIKDECYHLYKSNANDLVDQILKELNIETVD